MDNDKLIQKLLDTEAWATGLANECRRTRQELEGVSTSSSARKGDFDEKMAKVFARRDKHLRKMSLKAASEASCK